MNSQWIEEIVDEVLRRISREIDKRRALVLTCGDADGTPLCAFLSELKANGYSLTAYRRSGDAEDLPIGLVDQSERIDGDITHSASAEIVAGYDAIIMAGMRIGQLSALRDLRIENAEHKMVFEALRNNKEIYIFSPDISLMSASAGLRAKVNRLVAEIETFGITFPGFAAQTEMVFAKDVINKQDVVDWKEKLLMIKKDAIVTTTARALLKERGVEVVRK